MIRLHLRLLLPAAGVAIVLAGATASASALSVASDRVTSFATCNLQISAADATVDQSLTTNLGTAAELLVQSRNQNRNRRTLVRFDLSTCALPSTARIASAELAVFMVGAPSSSRTYEARPLTGTWTELLVTWLTQPGVASTFAAATTGTAANVRVAWDVTADVRAFHGGALDNNGWRIADRAESGSNTAVEARFAARENTTVARRPRLTIGYYP